MIDLLFLRDALCSVTQETGSRFNRQSKIDGILVTVTVLVGLLTTGMCLLEANYRSRGYSAALALSRLTADLTDMVSVSV